MAAPTPTARGTPEGLRLTNGFSTKVTFSIDSTIELWEKSVTPPGMDGGDPVDNTTQHETAWTIFRPRTLRTLTEVSFVAAYDPQVYTESDTEIINQEQTITVSFADGSTIAFFGWVRSMIPQEMVDGEQPVMDVVIVPSNWDTANDVEAGFAVAEVAGT